MKTQAERAGRGKVLGDRWRVLGVGLQGGKVSCGQEVWVKLVDASPPTMFAVDLGSGAYFCEEDLDEWVEGYDGRVFELGADFQKDPAIQNNEVRVIRGHALRFHVPGALSRQISKRFLCPSVV